MIKLVFEHRHHVFSFINIAAFFLFPQWTTTSPRPSARPGRGCRRPVGARTRPNFRPGPPHRRRRRQHRHPNFPRPRHGRERESPRDDRTPDPGLARNSFSALVNRYPSPESSSFSLLSPPSPRHTGVYLMRTYNVLTRLFITRPVMIN